MHFVRISSYLLHIFELYHYYIKNIFKLPWLCLHSNSLIIISALLHFQYQGEVTLIRASPFLGPSILMWKTLSLISKLTAAFFRTASLYTPHQEIQFPGSDQPHISTWAFWLLISSIALDIILFICHSWVRKWCLHLHGAS